MKNFLSILLWIPAIAVRWFFILIGVPAVGFSLVGDGAQRTPKMWKFWIDAEEEIPEWFEVKWWMYLFPFVMLAISLWSMNHWYPLITIYFIFAALSSVLGIRECRKFWWFAIRNPTRGFALMFEQPILEPRPNPDDIVYNGIAKSRSRFLRHGWQSEFWYLRAIGEKKFEFRIGWKFADGTPGFTPTFSLRLGS